MTVMGSGVYACNGRWSVCLQWKVECMPAMEGGVLAVMESGCMAVMGCGVYGCNGVLSAWLYWDVECMTVMGCGVYGCNGRWSA